MTDLDALKASLANIVGIEGLTETIIGGRRVYGFNGLTVAVDPNSGASAVESAIRNAVAMRARGQIAAIDSAPQPQGKPMSTPASAPGSFAASIRAMMDEARAGVAQARADGLEQVKGAVGKLNDAKTATAKVAGTMAKSIEDEAASVMSELGQISNDLGG